MTRRFSRISPSSDPSSQDSNASEPSSDGEAFPLGVGKGVGAQDDFTTGDGLVGGPRLMERAGNLGGNGNSRSSL